MIVEILGAIALMLPSADDPEVGPVADVIRGSSSELGPVVVRFEEDRKSVAARFPIASSPLRRERLRSFSKAWRDRLREAEFDGLGTEAKVDYLLLDNELKSGLARLDREERLAKEEAPLLPFSDAIVALVEARSRLDPVDPEAASEVVARLKTQVAEARKNRRGTQGRRRDRQAPGVSGGGFGRGGFGNRWAAGSAITTATTRCSRGG